MTWLREVTWCSTFWSVLLWYLPSYLSSSYCSTVELTERSKRRNWMVWLAAKSHQKNTRYLRIHRRVFCSVVIEPPHCMACICNTHTHSAETAFTFLLPTAYNLQWRLLGITWKEKVRNKEIRKKTRLRKLELIIRERWLRWLGHVLRIENSRTPRQAIQWELSRATRESRDGQGKTGWTSLDEIWRIWTLLGMKPKKVTKYHTEHN